MLGLKLNHVSKRGHWSVQSYHLHEGWDMVDSNLREILSEIHILSFNKMYLNMPSAKWWLFCLGRNIPIDSNGVSVTEISAAPPHRITVIELIVFERYLQAGHTFNSSSPGQNGRLFADIFLRIQLTITPPWFT